ncbi:hypothetical protein [Nocardia sp. NPDC057353]|uniref:hypothetical protein n=1 Tax=Nocardia sp. NPDC057353 TaxID=3346104 RepID=UPI003626796C
MTVGRPAMPHWRELTTAFRFPVGRHGTRLLERARTLATLHRVRGHHPGREAVFEANRIALRRQIAEWIIEHTEARSGTAALCATVIDDMAAAHVAAERLLRADPPPSTEELHAAWYDVGYLATHWADLVEEVVHGQRPVPRPPERA